MSFQRKEPSTFINIKLTDVGRRMLADGKLKFSRAVLSDREIDYDVISRNGHNALNNRILAPKDYHPNVSNNFDNSGFLRLGANTIKSTKLIITANTSTAGLFTGSTNNWSVDTTKCKARATTTAINTSSNRVTFGSIVGAAISTNDIVYIPWEPDDVSGSASASPIILSGRPINGMWYRITSAVSSSVFIVDRQVPYFASLRNVPAYFYPYSASSYYWSSYTVDSRVWGLSIIRNNDVEGTWGTVSGYTSYPSIVYNGSKHYFGLNNGDYKSIGILHYTGRYSGNTYAEEFIEKSFRLDLPTVLWHNVNQPTGAGVGFGVSFYDSYGGTSFDPVANTTYRELRENYSGTSIVVGRVYHKLKMAVITDQELLMAMTYKSNRSFTLPELNLELTTTPPYGYVATGATATTYSSSGSITTPSSLVVKGISKSSATYYVTYIVDSVTANTGSYETYGYPSSIHCGYIKKIVGEVDEYGQPKFIKATFNRGFPYMRQTPSSSGLGWAAHTLNILIQEVDNNEKNNSVDTISANKWRKMYTNGMFSATTSETAINPRALSHAELILTQEDYDASTNYYLPSVFTTNQNYLNFGDENFLFGNINVDVQAAVFKSSIMVMLDSNRFNHSNNSTYNGNKNKYTYITEIAILDDSNNVVGVAKPTYPIKKNELGFVGFLLEMDF